MTLFTNRIVLLVAVTSMVACTSLQQLPDGGASGANHAQRQGRVVVIGDTVTINLKSGAAYELLVNAVNMDFIAGTQDGEAKQVMFSDIESIEQKRFDIFRTALIVLGIIALGQYARGLSKLTNP